MSWHVSTLHPRSTWQAPALNFGERAPMVTPIFSHLWAGFPPVKPDGGQFKHGLYRRWRRLSESFVPQIFKAVLRFFGFMSSASEGRCFVQMEGSSPNRLPTASAPTSCFSRSNFQNSCSLITSWSKVFGVSLPYITLLGEILGREKNGVGNYSLW